MNKKINTICFIFLFLFLICAVSAADNESETISIQQPDPNQDLCKLSVENSEEKIELSDTENEKLEAVTTSVKKATVKKEEVTLKAPDVKMYYKDGSKFTVTLKDKNKKAIGKAKINITINGKSYNRLTDSKGKASLNLNLKSGSYIVLTSFAQTKNFNAKSIKSTVTVKSTIKCSDFTKYYKNTASYYSTFYNQKGNLLKNTAVKFKLNSKTYSVKTNAQGKGKLIVGLKPGKYSVSSINPKTGESVAKSVTIKSLIETNDMTMDEGKSGKFNVKVLNSNGKASSNKKVTIKVNGKTYTKTTNKNGIATLNVNLKAGKYGITTEYSGLKNSNRITVNKPIVPTHFVHTALIPDYVNVTTRYAFYNSVYTIKTGIDGIIKMPKNEIYTIQIGSNSHVFTTKRINGINSTVLDYKSYLIPFDGGKVISNSDKSKLTSDGIVISKIKGFTQIDYQSKSKDPTSLFGFYAAKGLDKSELLTYMENDRITAKIGFQTLNFDELGLQYSLSKFYGKTIYDFNYKSYDEITHHDASSIRFTNTGKPVTFSYFGNSIAGYISKEDILTKFSVKGKEELQKPETISYGLDENYRNSMGFEVLQSYSIINEKITKNILESWIDKNPKYLNRFGVMNVYGMHLASLETTWLADAFADSYSKEFNVNWNRKNTLVLLGGINLKDTYIDILNADMGMEVKGNNETDKLLFKLMNSINLPNLEDYALSKIAARYLDNTSNSFDSISSAIVSGKFSIVDFGEMIYLFAEDGSNSAITFNATSGVASVIMSNGNATYKGSSISTTKDCCSVGIIPKDIIAGIKDAISMFSPGIYALSDKLEKIHPFSILAYQSIKLGLGYILKGAALSATKLFTLMTVVQTIGTTYRDKMVNEKDWHNLMDRATFTRPGYLQGKKIYNIPNKNGGYDYIEVKINDDLTLNRANVTYISHGKTKKLTEAETYLYFSEDYWTPISMPTKYWDESWKR